MLEREKLLGALIYLQYFRYPGYQSLIKIKKALVLRVYFRNSLENKKGKDLRRMLRFWGAICYFS